MKLGYRTAYIINSAYIEFPINIVLRISFHGNIPSVIFKTLTATM